MVMMMAVAVVAMVMVVVVVMVTVTVATGSILISAHTIAVGVCLAFAGVGRQFVARTG